MRQYSRRNVLVLSAGATLSACAFTAGPPLRSQVLAGASQDLPGYAVYQVSRSFLPVIAAWPTPATASRSTWIDHQRGPAGSLISAGDKINLTIWDSSENSLLTSPGQKVVSMNNITVSPSGTVFVPYLGEILVTGLTPNLARKTVQKRMETIIPSAQVQIELLEGRKNSVELVSGVKTPGRYPLIDRNTTVLSLIALGGGVSDGLRNPQARLIRNEALYQISLDRLYATPRLDTTLRGGDKIIIQEDERYFIALGATTNQQLVYFPKDQLTATEALSLFGGTQQSADAKGLLIMRQYSDSAVRSDDRGPTETRAVFALDLTSADGLFSANDFQIHPGDMIFATEARITKIATILSLVRSAFLIANQTQDF